MTYGWHLDRMLRRQRGEELTLWPEIGVACIIAGPGLAFGLGIFIVALVLICGGV